MLQVYLEIASRYTHFGRESVNEIGRGADFGVKDEIGNNFGAVFVN